MIQKFTSIQWRSDLSLVQDEEYNNALPKFFSDYETYLKKEVEYINLLSRTVRVGLRLFNNGGAPAEDMDIDLFFPRFVEVYDSSKFPSAPKKPAIPKKPAEALKSMFSGGLYGGLNSSLLNPRSIEINNVSDFSLDWGEIIKASLHVTALKHHMTESLGELLVVLPEHEEAPGLEIEYQIIASNIPDVVKGKLVLDIVMSV